MTGFWVHRRPTVPVLLAVLAMHLMVLSGLSVRLRAPRPEPSAIPANAAPSARPSTAGRLWLLRAPEFLPAPVRQAEQRATAPEPRPIRPPRPTGSAQAVAAPDTPFEAAVAPAATTASRWASEAAPAHSAPATSPPSTAPMAAGLPAGSATVAPHATSALPGPDASRGPRPLLQDATTQRLIRNLARGRTVADEAERITEEPRRLNETERLGQSVAQSAKGDCLKGEYAGGGMGVLSLPFWVAAELSGQCRR